MSDLATLRRDRDKAKVSGVEVSEDVWICQGPKFLAQLRNAFVRATGDRQTRILNYARLCIAVGRKEYDECSKAYNRCHWKWSDEKLSLWLAEEVAKHKEEVRRNRQAGAKQAAVTRKAYGLAAEAQAEYEAELTRLKVDSTYSNDNH